MSAHQQTVASLENCQKPSLHMIFVSLPDKGVYIYIYTHMQYIYIYIYIHTHRAILIKVASEELDVAAAAEAELLEGYVDVLRAQMCIMYVCVYVCI